MSPGPAFAAPMYCPYCGEEDIRPAGSTTGDYACAACLRAWNLRLAGSYAPGADLGVLGEQNPAQPDPSQPERESRQVRR